MRPTPIQNDRPPSCTPPCAQPPRCAAQPAPRADASRTTGCSGQGAASAMRQWLRQHEERERVMDPAHHDRHPLA